MKSWKDLGIVRTSVVLEMIEERPRKGLGLMHGSTTIIDPELQHISDPVGELNWVGGAYAVLKDWDGRCGVIRIKIPFSTDNKPTIRWFDREVTKALFIGKGEFVLYSLNGRFLGIANINNLSC